MKKNNLKMTTLIIAMAMLIGTSVSAQNYLCTGNNVQFSVPTAGLNSGDNVEWYWDATGTTAVTAADGAAFLADGGVTNAIVRFTAGGTGANAFTTAANTVKTQKIYAKVVSGQAGACEADDIEEFTVVVLPALSVAVTTDLSGTTYCTNDVKGSQEVSATVTTITDLPAGVTVGYAWTLNGDAVATGVNSAGYTSTVTYSSPATAGTFTYAVAASYNIGSGTWIGSACANATDSESFTVVLPPTTPSISAGSF